MIDGTEERRSFRKIKTRYRKGMRGARCYYHTGSPLALPIHSLVPGIDEIKIEAAQGNVSIH